MRDKPDVDTGSFGKSAYSQEEPTVCWEKTTSHTMSCTEKTGAGAATNRKWDNGMFPYQMRSLQGQEILSNREKTMKAIADAALREDYSPEAVRIFRSMDAYETIFTLERLTDWLANGTKYRSDTQQFLDAFAEKARSGSPPPAHWVLYAAHLLLRAGIVVEEDKRSRNSRIAKELRLSGPRRLGRDTVVAAIVHKLVTEDGRRGNIEWAADRIANNWKALSESDLEGAPEWLTKHPLKDSYLKAKYREAKKVDVDLDLELLILNNGPDSLKKWVDLLVKPNM